MELAIELGHGPPERHSTEVETALYRITQEALTNARKHGGARRVFIDIHAYDHYLHLAVRDDGVGFDPHTKADRLGLDIIRERAELLGGTLEINSAPGRSTQITAVLLADRATSQRAS